MLTERENFEIREHLENAQNPLFFFDNDQDGLSSFLIFRRNLERGYSVPVKTSPLDTTYFRRIDEFQPDYIFILDQPSVSKDFFEAVRERNIPVVWIDHHENNLENIPDWVNYYNPLYSYSKTNEPVTDVCYRVFNRKEDLWLLVAGCIADKYIPKEYQEFFGFYPELGIETDIPFKILYESEIGKISRMMGMGLKDRTSFVMKMIRFLIEVKTPNEVLEENLSNQSMHKAFNRIDEKLKKFVEKVKSEFEGGNLIFFTYSGETSMSADIANRLSYLYPGKTIVVAFIKGVRVNLSVRGKNIREKVLNVLEGLPLSRGGGHEDAVGAQIDFEQLEEFKKEFEKLIS
jgi:single-stranded DNA-specific DHH superfamily exonuclease